MGGRDVVAVPGVLRGEVYGVGRVAVSYHIVDGVAPPDLVMARYARGLITAAVAMQPKQPYSLCPGSSTAASPSVLPVLQYRYVMRW